MRNKAMSKYALRAGRNKLEVKVTNLWSNRLLGEIKYPDGFPGRDGGNDFHPRNSIVGKLRSDRPLQPSGLAGPVQLNITRRIAL